MKKLLAVLLAACLLLSAAGCAEHPIETQPVETAPTEQTVPATEATEATVPTTEETQAPTEPTEPESYELSFSYISMPLRYEAIQAEDGSYLCEFRYQDVALILEDAEVAGLVTMDLLNKIDETEFDSVYNAAVADGAGQNGKSPYYINIYYSPVRMDSSVLSLAGTETSCTSEYYADTICKAVTYDLVTGNRVSYRDILVADCNRAELCNLIIEALAPQDQAGDLFFDYKDTIFELLGDSSSFTENWYFTTEGLCFFFPVYEIAPYATGTVTAVVPYDKLLGFLEDAWFPPEMPEATGNVTAELFYQADLSSFKQFAEVTVDDGGEMVLIHTDKLLRNVRIDIGSWDMDGVVFTPDCTVFATDTLCATDAVVVETYIPDAAPNLRLSYVSGGQTYVYYISQSGMDGSILLLETA